MSNPEKDYSYPKYNDKKFQEKIFKKREFYYHKIDYRNKLNSYDEIKKYRDENCQPGFDAREHQKIITNFINPNTPYGGLLLIHGTGTGKTASCISIAEQFKDQVKKYNTKIYVVVPGPNTRENFKSELLFSTGKTYLKNRDLLDQMSNYQVDRERKIGVYSALQFYKILSYKTFYKKILGEKIVEKKITADNKVINTYKKKEDGNYEREIVIDRINNMDNSILIIDEAHNLTGNEYGEALKLIMKKSKNLKLLLLTATPMKNLADDIIYLINFLRPENDQIKRDEIFTNEKNYEMKLKVDGAKILKEKSKGYISYFRGNIPFTFAKQVDKGEIPKSMLFTPLIRCKMEQFQLDIYKKAAENYDDTLDRGASSAANFIFPGLTMDRKKLTGYYSTDGMNKLVSQINSDKNKLLKLINKEIFKNKLKKDVLNNFIYENDKKSISGKILHVDYLQHFSVKFYKCIKRLNRLTDNKKGSGTAFIYSNLVKAGGMELFAECLIENGYLEYNENPSDYNIKDNTRDVRTGKTFSEFKKKKMDLSKFKPSTFILITGGIDDSGEDLPEIKQKIIRDVFNNLENKNGEMIKFVLGSKVMNEGVTLENIKEIHILDVHYNLGKVKQVIGRGIRMCKHQEVIDDNNRFPEVNVYRYVVSLKSGLSTDEMLYKKAELKYLLVKKVERILKEGAVDCPLLINGNKFPEEIEKNKNCHYPTLENIKKKKKICPELCDFERCDFKCDSSMDKYYDKKNGFYQLKNNKEVDYNTFNEDLGRFEIEEIKQKVKDLFRFKHTYIYDELLEKIINSIKDKNKDLFDKYFLDQALEELMPKTENDFNNFKDTIYDKYNRSGYLIQKDEYYIFQPLNENENVPMYYRKKLNIDQKNKIGIENYVKNNFDVKKIKKDNNTESKNKKLKYDFNSTLDYYDKRDENFIVGIIDMKNNNKEDGDDLFKIRQKRSKVLDKKRGTGIPTLKGAVCSTSKDKEYLINIIKKLPKIDILDDEKKIKKTRENLCNIIKNKLLYLEKYSRSKDNNKITYIMIPNNHLNYEFPYNLEDRIKYNLKIINKIINRKINSVVKKLNKGTFLNIDKNKLISYQLIIDNNKYTKEKSDKLKKLGFKLKENKWIKLIN